MTRVADIVVRFLADRGIKDLFLVSGGGIMYLVDAAGLEKRLRCRVNNHEQASAIAAESNARMTGNAGACLVTTGPGSMNALSAIPGAYVDSVPLICISGQVRTALMADFETQRQYGPQEVNIIPMAQVVTKHAVTVCEPTSILAELELAWHMATTGRPGPVWLNIPLDVQGAQVDEATLKHAILPPIHRPAPTQAELEQAADILGASRRPIILAGGGVRFAGAVEIFREFVRRTGIPVLLPIGAMDLLTEDDPANMGRFGPSGQRRANFALQNADALLSIGASMSIASIGFNTGQFAVSARSRIMVNLDDSELRKPNYRPNLAIRADAGAFLEAFFPVALERGIRPSRRWSEACAMWKERYRPVGPEQAGKPEYVSSYVFVDKLSDALSAGDVILTGNSLDVVTVYQAFKVREGQRLFTNVNWGSMGWDLPGAIGAACDDAAKRTILVTGDGSLQFNSQELMTARVNDLNLKVFVFNNQGYQSIRTTQTNYFEGRFVGSDFASGIGNPNFSALASAYGFEYAAINTNSQIDDVLGRVLSTAGPVLVELNVDPEQGRIPRITSVRRPDGTMESRPIHDMFPFLPEEEVRANMTMFDDE